MESQTKLTLPTIASVSTIIVTALIGTAIVSQSTSALTYQDSTDVKFTFNPTININLSSTDLVIPELTSGSSSDSNEVTVSVSTNTGYGYYLSATAGTKTGNTSLNNTLDSSYKFTNLTANAPSLSAMPDNSWGYSYSTDNGTTWVSGDAGSTMTGYNGLPLDNDDSGATGIKLVSTDSFTSSSSIKFKIGAKSAPTQAAGTYTNTVNFYAVANPAPMGFDEAYAAAGKEKLNGYYQMQDATPEICAAVAEGKVGLVIDTRDDTVYHIGKLADGNCWLLDNLALDLTNSTVLNGMNESNTNASNTTLGYLKNGGGTTSDKYAITGVVNWTDSPTYASSYSYSDPLVNLTNKDIVPADATSTAGQYKVGGYYNYCAASAGSYCYGNGTSEGTSSGNATEDICPKGWRMPTGGSSGEYQALYSNASYNTYANYRSALRLPLSGVFSSGSATNQGSNGYFWSSARGSNLNMYYLFLSTGSILPVSNSYRYPGISVRCVLGL